MKIVELDSKRLIGLRVLCEGDEYVHEIPKATAALKERLAEVKGAVYPEQFIGAFVVGDCPDEEDGYWIGVEVNQDYVIPDGMVSLTIPSQKYAVITHEGPNTEIRNTYELLHQWIASMGLERNLSSWHLEISKEGTGPIELHDTIK
ncbi:MAG: transcription activator [Paenibacillus sp.]|jgi:predicted transcriptional regulator YdeE|nr:transcription activator [Paenibacillus sp.]